MKSSSQVWYTRFSSIYTLMIGILYTVCVVVVYIQLYSYGIVVRIFYSETKILVYNVREYEIFL